VPIVETDMAGRPAKLYADVLELAKEHEPGVAVAVADVEAYCVGLAAAWTRAGADWGVDPFSPAAVADWLLCEDPDHGMDCFLRWFGRKEAADAQA
jgi:hypothetical protein